MVDSPGVVPPAPRCSSSLSKALSAAVVVLAALIFGSCSGEEPLGYASLGDSLAAGVGASAPSETSYSALYHEALEERTSREVEYRQLGLSGETARTFIGGYPEGDSQLVRAEEFLERHPGARVTLSLGGNDLLRARGDSERQKREAIADYGGDLGFILATLNAASEPPPSITVLTLYNPEPGALNERWVRTMNEKIRATASEHGASVAESERAFKGPTQEYLRRYESGARDIHPSDRGYEALARTLVQAGEPPSIDDPEGS